MTTVEVENDAVVFAGKWAIHCSYLICYPVMVSCSVARAPFL